LRSPRYEFAAIVVVLVLVALFLLGDGNPVEGVTVILDGIARGQRLTTATYGSDGVVNADPQGLADLAGASSLDAYALARMISSEEGKADNTTKAAVAWAAVNHAAKIGKTISQVLLSAHNSNHNGFFGTQRDIDQDSPDFDKSDRYASTALDPYQGDLDIAEGVLSGDIADLTGGAVQFDRPASEKNPTAVAASRVKEGKTEFHPPGVDPGLRFWV